MVLALMDIKRMERSTSIQFVHAKQLARDFLHALATVCIFIVAIGAMYIPFDRWRTNQHRHVTVLDCELPSTNTTLVSLVRVHSDQMKAGAKPSLTLVDLHNERLTREIPWSGSLPSCFTTSFDERRLFVGTRNGQIFRLDRDRCTGQREFVVAQAGIRLEQVAISSDHKDLVGRGFHWLGAWNLETRSLQWKRTDIDCNALSLASSAALICGTNNGEILELSLESGKTLQLLARHKTNIRHIAAAADTLVSVDGTGDVILFRRQARTWVRRPSDKVFSGNNRLCLSADGKWAVGTSRNNTALICWNLDEQEPICHMTGHAGIILNAGFLPDGSILSCGNDGTVRVWDLAAHGALRLVTRISPLFAG